MAEALIIREGNLSDGLNSLVAAKREFDTVKDQANESADACGHDRLASALREAASSWSLRRGALSETLDNLAGHLRNTIDQFGNVDEELARMMRGDGDGGSPQSSAPSGGSRDGGLSGGSGRGGQPSAVQAPAEGPAPDLGPVTPPSPAAPIGPATRLAPGTPLDLGIPLVPQMPAAGPPVEPVQPSDTDKALQNASLEELLDAIVARWMTLGGAEAAILGTLAGLGLGAQALGGPSGGVRGEHTRPDGAPHSEHAPRMGPPAGESETDQPSPPDVEPSTTSPVEGPILTMDESADATPLLPLGPNPDAATLRPATATAPVPTGAVPVLPPLPVGASPSTAADAVPVVPRLPSVPTTVSESVPVLPPLPARVITATDAVPAPTLPPLPPLPARASTSSDPVAALPSLPPLTMPAPAAAPASPHRALPSLASKVDARRPSKSGDPRAGRFSSEVAEDDKTTETEELE